MSPLFIEVEGCRAVVVAHTLGSDGYEIVGSVTAIEFIAGTCRETLWFV